MNEDWLSFSQKGEFQSCWRAGSTWGIEYSTMAINMKRNTMFVHTIFWYTLSKFKLRKKDVIPPMSEK